MRWRYLSKSKLSLDKYKYKQMYSPLESKSLQRFKALWQISSHMINWSLSVRISRIVNLLLSLLTSVLSMVLVTSYLLVLLVYCLMIVQRLWPHQISSTLYTLNVCVMKVPILWSRLTSITFMITQRRSIRKLFCSSILSPILRATASSVRWHLILRRKMSLPVPMTWITLRTSKSGSGQRKQYCFAITTKWYR